MSRPSIEQQITFLYTKDLATSAQFYSQVLGLELWLDQGSCKIYQVSDDGYLGLCQASETKAPLPGEQNHVIFTLVTQQVDEWYEYLQQQGLEFEKPPTNNKQYDIYHCFLRDPDSYLIEIQRFGARP